MAHGSLVVRQGSGRLADSHQPSNDSCWSFTPCRHRFTTQPFGSYVSEDEGLTVRVNVPRPAGIVEAVLGTLGVDGDVEEEEGGTLIVIWAATLDEIRQIIDDVLVALGDL